MAGGMPRGRKRNPNLIDDLDRYAPNPTQVPKFGPQRSGIPLNVGLRGQSAATQRTIRGLHARKIRGAAAQPLTRKLPALGITPANYANGLDGLRAIGNPRATARLGRNISRKIPKRAAVVGGALALGIGGVMGRSGRSTDRGRSNGIYGY